MEKKVKKRWDSIKTGVFWGLAMFGLLIASQMIWEMFDSGRKALIEYIVLLLTLIVFLIVKRKYQKYLRNGKGISPFFSFTVMFFVYSIIIIALSYITGVELLGIFVFFFESMPIFIFVTAICIYRIIMHVFYNKNGYKLYYIEFILPTVIFSNYKLSHVENFFDTLGRSWLMPWDHLPSIIQIYLDGILKFIIILLIYSLALFILGKLSRVLKKAGIPGVIYFRNGLMISLYSFLVFSLVYTAYALIFAAATIGSGI